eukprot:SAG11_NODE_2102_length_3820_cov_2.233808_2_plen_177_part_00
MLPSSVWQNTWNAKVQYAHAYRTEIARYQTKYASTVYVYVEGKRVLLTHLTSGTPPPPADGRTTKQFQRFTYDSRRDHVTKRFVTSGPTHAPKGDTEHRGGSLVEAHGCHRWNSKRVGVMRGSSSPSRTSIHLIYTNDKQNAIKVLKHKQQKTKTKNKKQKTKTKKIWIPISLLRI